MMAPLRNFELDNLDSGFNVQELIGTSSTDSISKGVFVFKGKKRGALGEAPEEADGFGSKRSKKNPSKAAGQASSLVKKSPPQLWRLFDERGFDRKIRGELLAKYWAEAERAVEELQLKYFSCLVGQVSDHVLRSGKAFSEFASETGKKAPVFSYYRETDIPTCAILTGINTPDHDDFFRLLVAHLKTTASPHIASIKAKEGSTLRQLLKTILLKLRSKETVVEDQEDDEEGDDGHVPLGNQGLEPLKSGQISFRTLLEWYDAHQSYEGQSMAGKSQKKSSARKSQGKPSSGGQRSPKRPPIVIVFEDFEAFSPRVLQDFILNLSLFSDKIPVTMIFGVATTIDAIHFALPHTITSRLAIEKLTAQPSKQLLTDIIEGVLVRNSGIPFKIGCDTLGLLIDTFLFKDFSIKHFLMTYKFCLLEHFSSCGASLLCQSDEKGIEAAMEALDKTELNTLMALCSSTENVPIAKNAPEAERRRFLCGKVTELLQVTDTFNIFVGCLNFIAKDLPGKPLGMLYHFTYLEALKNKIISGHGYRETFQFFGFSEKSGLVKRLAAFVDYLESHGGENAEAVAASKKASRYLAKLEGLGKEAHEKARRSKDAKEVTLPSLPSPSNKPLQRVKLDRFKLQEALLEQVKEKKRQSQNPFESLRSEVLDFLHCTFKRCLVSPMTLPLHKVFYFDDAVLVRSRTIGAPRAAVQRALQVPFAYLNNEVAIPDGISPALPDICIAYKLYLECGRYINLFDWLQCWVQIVTSGRDDSKLASGTSPGGTMDDGSVTPELQARFARAVSELQLLGFIRTSKRKTDHVERLTWNS